VSENVAQFGAMDLNSIRSASRAIRSNDEGSAGKNPPLVSPSNRLCDGNVPPCRGGIINYVTTVFMED